MPTANSLAGFFQGVPQQYWSRCTHSVPPTRASNVNSGSFHEDGASGNQLGSCGCSMTAAKPYTRAAARNKMTVRKRALPSATCWRSPAPRSCKPQSCSEDLRHSPWPRANGLGATIPPGDTPRLARWPPKDHDNTAGDGKVEPARRQVTKLGTDGHIQAT